MKSEFSVLIALIVLRHVTLTYFPQVVFSAYAYMFAIAFALSYNILRDLKAATLIAMSVTLSLVIYKYNKDTDGTGIQDTVAFVTGVTAIFVASHLIKSHIGSTLVDISLYGIILYVVTSLTEWFGHRYVMHCYQNSKWILNLPDNYAKSVCVGHKLHHLSVNADMSLNENHRDNDIVFEPVRFIELGLLLALIMTPIIYGLDINIDMSVNIICSVSVGFIFVIVWNSIHTKMHDKKVDVPLSPKIDVPDILYTKMVNNHDMHHQIKGDEKGNFNVLFLGADDIMGTNNKSVPE